MIIKSAYLETRARVHKKEITNYDIFYRSTALSGCQVSDLLDFQDCPTAVSGINSYSDLFLTGKVLWYHGAGARLWRINHNTASQKWTLAVGSYADGDVQYQLRLGGGASVYMTISGEYDLIVFASRGAQGGTEWWKTYPLPEILQYSPSTVLSYDGIGGSGYYLTSPFAPSGATPSILISEALEASGNQYVKDEYEVPIEGEGFITDYALNDFFGLDEEYAGTPLDPYPNRMLLSYNDNVMSYMYIPIPRQYDWQTIKAECKVLNANTEASHVGIAAGAVVDGQMVEVRATTDSLTWTNISADITSLPYVDYVILIGGYGAQGIRNLFLQKIKETDEEEY